MKKGISLIVLIITIIIIMILAGAVILTMSDTDMIAKSQEAIIQNDKANVQDAVTLHLATNSIYNDEDIDNEGSKTDSATAYGVVKIFNSTTELKGEDKIEINAALDADGGKFKYPKASIEGAVQDEAVITWKLLGIEAPASYTAGTHVFYINGAGVVTVEEGTPGDAYVEP